MVYKCDLIQWLHILHDDGEIVEIRIMEKTPRKRTLSGYFKVGADDEILEREVAKQGKKTIYQTMNELDPALYSRKQQRQILQVDTTTSDNNVTRLRWILIDFDPNRAAEISSSDEEKEIALGLCRRVYRDLREAGFEDPVVADSGNGYHLLFRIDVEASKENADIVKRFLNALNDKYHENGENAGIAIDTTVYNPARITKLYSSFATKGMDDVSGGRPWRASKIITAPEEIKATDFALIEKLASVERPKDEPPKKSSATSSTSAPPASSSGSGSNSGFQIEDFLARHGIGYKLVEGAGMDNSDIFRLDECPFNSDHKDGDAKIFRYKSGALSFKCQHHSCAGKKWQDVRTHFEPEAYEIHLAKPTKPLPAEEPEEPQISLEEYTAKSAGGNLDSFLDEIERSKTYPEITTGFKGLDKLLEGGLYPGLYILGAVTSLGKTDFMLQMCDSIAEAGTDVIYISLEMAQKELTARSLSRLTY